MTNDDEIVNYYIYCHTFPNNKLYFGVCNREPEYRWGKDGNGYKGQLVYKAICKYGWANIKHDILFRTTDIDEAVFLENFLISKYNTIDSAFGYNVSPGNYNNSWNLGLKAETNVVLKSAIDKSSKTQRAKYASGELVVWNKGLTKDTSESVRKYSKTLSSVKKGCKPKRKYKDMTGSNNPNFGNYWSDEQKATQSAKLKGRRPPNARYVECVEDCIVYDSLGEAGRLTHIDRHKIAKCCNGELDTVCGKHWRYTDGH